MHWNVSIGPDKWPFSNVISIKMSCAARKKYLQYGGRHHVTSLQVFSIKFAVFTVLIAPHKFHA
jgi:hypothetical protein